ncbi:MAG: choice-of-anchor L domain-containing protein [Nodosilinea sp.]
MISITPTNNATTLLNALTGDTTGLSNIQLSTSGDARAFGTFSGAPFAFTSGVVISTGQVADLVGPNGSDDTGTDFAPIRSPNGDTISITLTFDADNSLVDPKIFFEFIFGSEEFPEFAQAGLNDSFELKLNGVNLAKLNDGQNVTIDNLAPNGPSGPFHPDYVDNTGGQSLELDAYTRLLTFAGNLIPGQQNTLTIVVKDEGDGNYDSAVFLRSASVSTTEPPDITTPFITAKTPADNATDVALAANIILNFNEAVQKGTGNLTIKRVSDDSVVETINVTSGLVTVSGKTVTVNPTNDLSSSTAYYVEVASGAITDLSNNAFAGISGNTTFNFATADTIPPTISTLSPADNATEVAIGSNIVLTFSEMVQKGTGNITIFNGADDSVFATIAVTSGIVTVSGNTVTINPTSDLVNGRAYYIQIAATAITDTSGNAFAGISNKTSFNFTTEALPNTPPSFTSASTTSFAENATGTVIDVNATDSDGPSAVTYSLVAGGVDNSLFDIDSTTGIVTFKTSPNFEAPADNGTNNVYNIRVQATDGADPITQDLGITVTNVNEPTNGSISVSGTYAIGQQLTAVTTAIGTDPDGPITIASYQWQVSSTGTGGWGDISEATSSTLTLTAGQANQFIRVRVLYSDGTFSNTINSAASGSPVPPPNTPPTATNSTVTATEDITYTFTVGNFNFSDADSGDTLQTVKITSLPSSGSLKLNGNAVIGNQDIALADITAGRLTFAAAANANGTSYANFGFRVSDGEDFSAATYTATINVTPVDDAPTGNVTITGSPQEDSLLTADTSTLADVDGLPNSSTYTYQWQQFTGGAWANISGANSSTFTPGDGQAGKDVRVRVRYTDLGGTAEIVDSAGVTIVNVNDAPVLDNSGTPTLAAIDEDVISGANVGTKVSDLIAGLVTDVDGDPKAIAITGASNTVNGRWEYSTNGGTTWTPLDTVSDSAATLLGATSLYQASLGTAPDSQTWLSFTNLSGATQTASSAGTTLSTTSSNSIYAGYSNFASPPAAPTLVNPNFPVLNATDGFSLSFQMQLLAESRTNQDRAGFSVIIVTSDAAKAIELGFQRTAATMGKIFAQDDGANLFKAAENVSFDTTASTDYTVSVQGNTYKLLANGTQILTGSLRDYRPFTSTTAPDPYETPNFVFLGDDTTSAQASFNLSQVVVQTDNRVRFVPNANYTGSADLTFRAWDTSDGKASGQTVDTSTPGGSTPFSSAAETATLTINAVNDAPTGSLTITGTPQEDNLLTADTSSLADVDGLPNSSTYTYQWQQFTGGAWANITGATSSTFTPGDAQVGKDLRVQVSYTDLGGTAETVVSAGVTITNVNDAPVLASINPTLNPVVEDSGAPAGAVGTLVSALINLGGNVTDPDPEAATGIALTGADSANGTWYFSTNNGGSWSLVASNLSNTTALLLNGSARLYFRPNPNYDGSASLTFRAWDTTAGIAGTYVSIATNGGSTAFSSAIDTASVDVTGVNDAPVNLFRQALIIPELGATTPYPIFPAGSPVAGLSGTITGLTVTLIGLSHQFPDDLDILLQGPDGKVIALMSDAGGSTAINNLTLTFSDGAATDIANNGPLTSGTSKPKDYEVGEAFPNGTPAITGTTLAQFIGTNPNGDWKVYIVDDTSNNKGSLAGYELKFTTSASETFTYTVSTISEVAYSATTVEDIALTFSTLLGNAVQIEDIDAGTSTLVVTLTGTQGIITAVNTGNVVIDNNGTSTVTLTGTLANINAALDGLSFTPTANYTGTASFVIAVDDQGASGSGGAGTDSDTVNITVTAVNDGTGSGLTITGTAAEGQTLTANTAGITDPDGLASPTYTYQWQAFVSGNWQNIATATDSTFTPDDAQVGQQIRVQVSYTDAQGFSETIASAGTSAITAVDDGPGTGLTVTGTATEGQTLTANTAGITDPDGLASPTYTYQWQAFVSDTWQNIAAATSSTFTLDDPQVGKSVRVAVSYTDAQSFATTIFSAGTSAITAVNDGPGSGLTISGSPAEESTLTAITSGIIDPDGLSNPTFTYQWQAFVSGNWQNITGATSSTFTPNDAQVGQTLRVQVSYTDAQGFSETITSPATPAITAINDGPGTGLTLSGTATEGQTLTAVITGIADPDGLSNPTYTYQWQAFISGSWQNITNATDSTFTPDDPQVGQSLRVQVSYTDAQGFSETVASNGTSTITAVSDGIGTGLTVSGTATENQTLTADVSSLQDNDGLVNVTYSYQWQYLDGSTWTNISNATASTLTLNDAQVGRSVRVQVIYTDNQGFVNEIFSTGSAVVQNVNDAPSGGVTLSGTPTQGEILTANTTTLADEDGLGALIYRWESSATGTSGWTLIDGATASTFTLTQAQVGRFLRVVVSYTDQRGTAENVTSAVTTAAIANVNESPTGGVAIDGTATQGQTLTANTATLADVDGLGPFTYRWESSTTGTDGWAAIDGATASTFTLPQGQVGRFLRVVVRYTDQQGTNESVTSSATTAVANVNDAPTGGVAITGTATQGQTLTANTATLADVDGLGTLAYRWEQSSTGTTGWTAIDGATASTLALTQAQVGLFLRVVVSYTDQQGADESVTSTATTAVANVNDAPTGGVTIDGTATQNQVLTANTAALGDIDGLGTFTYRWESSSTGTDGWATIDGATASTFILTQAQVGRFLRVVVSYTDQQSVAESVASAATTAITNVNDLPTGSVTLGSTPTQGEILTANAATLADIDGLGTFTYRWEQSTSGTGDWTAIDGATASTFTLNQGQVGAFVRVVVLYTDQQGTSESVPSAATTTAIANVNDAPTGSVAIDGTATQNQVLTANTTTLADIDGLGTLTYRWESSTTGTGGWTTIDGASGSTLTLTQAQVGSFLRVVVAYTDQQGTNESVTSAATAAVANVNDAPTGGIAITGTPQEDSLLTVNTAALVDIDGLPSGGTYAYQWQRFSNGEWANITGATGGTFTPGDGEVRQQIRVQLTYTDLGGTVETVHSPGVTIANLNDAPVVTNQTFVLKENSPTGTIVGTVPATDADGDPLTYTFLSGNDNGRFALDAATGIITVANGALLPDFETGARTLTLGLQVADASPDNPGPLSSRANVTITIADVNEHSDFNGDASSDIVWRNSDGVQYVWFLDNGSPFASSPISLAVDDPLWKIEGIGDFDNDGKEDDLAWYHQGTGEIALWYLENQSSGQIDVVGGGGLGNQLTALKLKGIGDFSGDHYQDDLIFFNSATSQSEIWFIDQGQVSKKETIGATQLITPGIGWDIGGVGDFDNDGRQDDIFFRNAITGDNSIWFMEGGTAIRSEFIASLDTRWELVGISDFNGNLVPNDLLWRNASEGITTIWFMDGTTLVGGVADLQPARPDGFSVVV